MEARRIRRAFPAFSQDKLVSVRVALDAHLEHMAAHEQLRIIRTVRGMTDGAAFYLDRRMFKDERPLLISVTFHAGRIRAGGQTLLFGFKSAMRVMTIAALHEAFQHLVVEGHRELSFLLGVTLKAQTRLAIFELPQD
jgi:hypothetical protein